MNHRSSARSFFSTALVGLAAVGLAGCDIVSPDGWVFQPFAGPGFVDDQLTLDLPADHSYVVGTTYLPVRTDTEANDLFSRHMEAIQAELDAEPEGLVGYSLAQSLLVNEYRTVSVWTSYEAMYGFVLSEAHVAAMTDGGRIEVEGEALVADWQVTADELPPRWEDAIERIETSGRAAY